MPTSTDVYGSHLPVLKALSVPMRRVLEFGSGYHSTPFFLSLPNLERLVSVEDDPTWFERAQEFKDERLTLVREFNGGLADFDLIFIDDGREAADREKTIRWVLGQPHPPVVIHDAEVYASVISEYCPATAVIL